MILSFSRNFYMFLELSDKKIGIRISSVFVIFNKSFCDMTGKKTTRVGFTVMTHALLIR